jgi:tetratricopeptide (TPR) repeat protein
MVDVNPDLPNADRAISLIEHIVALTLKGEIRSKEQVGQMLQADLDPQESETFAACLVANLATTTEILATETDTLKHARATRRQRALNTLQSEFERWRKETQGTEILSGAIATVMQATGQERLTALLQALDPNQPTPLTRDQITTLAQQLRQLGSTVSTQPLPTDLAAGLTQGLATWQRLEGHIISWIYDQGQQAIGFGNDRPQGPWAAWAKQVETPAIQQLFQHWATPTGVPSRPTIPTFTIAIWLELAIALQRLQLALVRWFDQQPYDVKAGKRLSISTYLTFAIVWSDLANHFTTGVQPLLAEGSFQVALQVLRQFAQQPYFPLYGGLFTALSGESLDTVLNYLEQPLRQVPNTDTKARILTLLGYSQQALGQTQRAQSFHEQALASAQAVKDQRCEIANLNHLSRNAVITADWETAIARSQHALMLARQVGDRLGEANALTNLGYAEIARAQTQIHDPDAIEAVLTYLEQGLALTQQVGDRPSEALCMNSLGIALVLLQRYDQALPILEQGLQVAQAIGDQALRGSHHSYLAIAQMHLTSLPIAAFHAALGMYLLWQIGSQQWLQPAGNLTILAGQLGAEGFATVLEDLRPAFLKEIGVDGYDYLPQLLTKYRESLT